MQGQRFLRIDLTKWNIIEKYFRMNFFSSPSAKNDLFNLLCEVKAEAEAHFPLGGGGGQKSPPTSFSSVASTNIGIRPQIFLTFSFDPFATLF